MDLGWIVTFASPTNPAAQVSFLIRDPSGLHPEVRRRGFEVVYPLRDEPWGVRRFFVRDPGGALVNVVGHLP